MKLYLDDELLARHALISDLEIGLARLMAGKGRRSLILDRGPESPTLYFRYHPRDGDDPEGYSVAAWFEKSAETLLSYSWTQATDCLRRFLNGEDAFLDEEYDSDGRCLFSDCGFCRPETKKR